MVVSINHRLNILGYTDLSDFGMEYENSGNAGGDDIIAALSWIHDNILNFGGDPENVTVFGQSGGGVKVTTLLQSPEADGLIARGIIMSGVIRSILEDSKGSGKELVDAIMERLEHFATHPGIKNVFSVLLVWTTTIRNYLENIIPYYSRNTQKFSVVFHFGLVPAVVHPVYPPDVECIR